MDFTRTIWSGIRVAKHRDVLLLCILVIVVVYSPAVWLGVVSKKAFTEPKIAKNGFTAPKFTVTSQLDNYGPEGLGDSAQPGWHAARPPNYPESITVDLRTRRQIRLVGLLRQDGLPARAPKALGVEISDDGNSWTPVAGSDDACAPNTPDGWSNINFAESVTTRYVKVIIFSNCGDPELLTLRGLRFG